MLIEKQIVSQKEVLVGDIESEGFDMQISSEDMSYIMNLLSDLYKDPYSIIPQETLSNSWDSHVEANCLKEPIICELKKDVNSKWYFAAQDFGVGISPERIRIFSNYGKSTKRLSNDYIGGWGIGAKVPLCYTKTFYVDTVFNGARYVYYIAPNPEGIPHIDLLDESPTDLSNRSKVWFYLKPDANYYSQKEHSKFLEGIRRKTIYFNNLVYDLDPSLDNLNSYKRIEGKHFVFSEAQPFNNLHILLGQVPYELDFQLLGLPTINVPIAIKIDGGVMPTPTREAFVYSDKAIEIIKEAIKNAAAELVQLCNKKRVDITDWQEWLNKRNLQPIVELGNKVIGIQPLVQYSDVPLQNMVFTPLKGLDTSNINADTILPFKCHSKISSGRRGDYNNSGNYGRQSYFSTGICMKQTGGFVSKKNTYLYTEEGHDLIYVFRKQHLKLKDYVKLLNLKMDDKANWRKKIVQYQKFVNDVWDNIPSYDDVIMPKEYLQKARSRSNKPQGVVVTHVLNKKDIYDSQNPAIGRKEYVKEFIDKKLVIYGTQDDLRELEKIWKVIPEKQCKLMYLAESNFKYLNSHQYINMNNWHKTKAFSRVVTAWKIKQLLESKPSLCNYPTESYYSKSYYTHNLFNLSQEYKDLVIELSQYSNKNLKKNNSYSYDRVFMEECMKVADAQRLWDYSVYYKIGKLEEYFNKFSFVTVFKTDVDWISVAANYIKKVTKDVRMNLNWYQKPKEVTI